jgi:hypothetical protein
MIRAAGGEVKPDLCSAGCALVEETPQMNSAALLL